MLLGQQGADQADHRLALVKGLDQRPAALGDHRDRSVVGMIIPTLVERTSSPAAFVRATYEPFSSGTTAAEALTAKRLMFILHSKPRSAGGAMAVKEGWRGRYFEDFEVGDVYQHRLGRTITETDNAWFTLLTLNTNQLHFNVHYATQHEFGRPVVNSGLTLCLVLGMSVSDISENGIANLGWDEIRLTNPVFVGDTLYAESIVLDKRGSGSRPHAGIVTVRTRAMNQEGDVCITFKRTLMVYRRDAPQDKGLFPQAAKPMTLDD